MYQVLARKWRPKNFHELVGQQHVTQALTYALDHDRIHHAYLFTGTRGVGKTTIARIFAKSLNCQTNGVSAEPCGSCAHCLEIDRGRFPDLIEVDAASRTGVDDTRELLDNVPYAPVKGRFKVYLIDEVHMFSRSSFNALLKTLEEPPPHVKFILATTDPQKMPATVLSRCLQFHLKNMTTAQIAAHLQRILDHDGIAYEEDGLNLLAEAGAGSMRDSLSLLDQAIAYGRGAVHSQDVAQLLGAVPAQQLRAILHTLADADAPALRRILHTLDAFAPDYPDLLRRLLYQLQAITIAQLGAERYSGEIDAAIRSLAQRLPVELVQLWYQIATDGWQSLAYQPDSRLAVEMILLRMIALRPVLPTADVATLAKIPDVAPAEESIAIDGEDGFAQMQALLHGTERAPSPDHDDNAAVATDNAASTAQQAASVSACVAPSPASIVDEMPPPWGDETTAAQAAVSVPAVAEQHTEHAPVEIGIDDGQTQHDIVLATPYDDQRQTTADGSQPQTIAPVPTQDDAVSALPPEQTADDDTPTAAEDPQSMDLADCVGTPAAWAEMVAMLDGLSDQARAVLDHSVVLAWHAPNLTLGMNGGVMKMADDTVCAVIAGALTRHRGVACTVRVCEDEADHTPAALRNQAEIDDQQRAERAVYDHPTVQFLTRRLGATVVPGSITSRNKPFHRS